MEQYPAPNPETDNRPETPEVPAHDKISGWLKFFLIFFVCIGSVFSIAKSGLFVDGHDFYWNPEPGDLAFSILYFIIGLFTITAFYRRQADAVYLARIYIVMCFIGNVLVLCVADFESEDRRVIKGMINSLFWSGVWFVFTYRSEQIKRLFPKEKRKILLRDWLLALAAIAIPAVITVYNTDTGAVSATDLRLEDGQYTDGRIIFVLPEDFVAEEKLSSDSTLYFYATDTVAGTNMTIVSGYDNDISEENFDEYWQGWRDDDLANYKTEVVEDFIARYDSTETYFYKRIKIETEQPVDWEFGVLFDRESGKMCVASSYCASGNISSVQPLFDRLHFLKDPD